MEPPMSGSSYPSPISSTASPDATSFAPVPDVPTVTSVSSGNDPIDTQRSLHQASAALEAAYNRIRQVRRNLLELTEALPPSQRRISGFNDIGPGHEAITLTEASAEDPETLDEDNRSMPLPNVDSLMGRLMRYERILGLDNAVGRDSNPSPPALPRRASSQSGTNPLPFSQRPNTIPHHPSRRRNANPDDASTSLGRRVAAREAAGVTPSRNSSRFPLADHDLEELRLSMRQRRTTEPQRLEPLIEHRREDASARMYQNAQRFAQIEGLMNSAGLRPGGRPRPEPRRRLGEPRYSQSATSGSTHSERLSLLSNLSVQNLATPGSGSISRPLLFDEPSSYIPVANFTSPSEPREEPEAPVGEEERNYVIRRRMNADGEEHIHPINLDWSDEEISWMLPRVLQDEATYDQSQLSSRFSRLSARYHPRRDTIQSAQIPPGRQRRRGWARLDADGNEIPSDEEEEIERIRAEYRVRAQNRPRPLVTAPTQGVEIRPRLHTLHSPMPNTRTGISPDEDLAFDADDPPRVHLGPHDSRASYGSVMDSVATVDGPRRYTSTSHPSHSQPKPVEQYTPPARPFCANPLPMPLEEMVPVRKSNKNDRPRVIRVSEHAIFAGR